METTEVILMPHEEFPVIKVKGYYSDEAGKKVKSLSNGLLKEKKYQLILDLSECFVINSPGIASIFDVGLKIQDDFKGRMILAGLDQTKASILRAAGILPLFDTADSLAEAKDLLLD
jgi:anti-anti-sigma regulatory factor